MPGMFAGKPIIGIAGGIGSGKSFIAGLFAEAGCRVIDADAAVHAIYRRDEVKAVLRSWWGGEVFTPTGEVDRPAIARRVFADEAQRRRLEALIHPLVEQERDREMAADTSALAFVWDVPLLFEAGLDQFCDVIVFVEASAELRLTRVCGSRQWSPDELARRENLQLPLDRKRKMSDYRIRNDSAADQVRRQVREVLSQILAAKARKA
jgi:dephospho-CoA kinase